MRAEPSGNESFPEDSSEYAQFEQEPAKEDDKMAGLVLEVIIGDDRKVSQSGGHGVPAEDFKLGDPEIYIERDEDVTFMNNSGESVTIIIPIDDSATIFANRFIHLDAGAETTLPVASDATKGVHPYCVYLKESDTFAEENSTPKMMIEPPEDDEMPPPSETK
jgi:hypothetical protein